MTSVLCSRCGSYDQENHAWIEGDCILPHRRHSKATIGHVCAGCVAKHRDWLSEITDLYATLGEVVAAGSIPDDTAEHKRPKKQPASPAPLRLEAWAMIHDRERLNAHGRRRDDGSFELDYTTGLPDVPEILAGWASYATETGAPPTSTTVDTVTAAVVQLTASSEHIAGQPWIDDYDADLRWIRRSLRSAHGITDPQALGQCITVTDGKDCGGNVWRSQDGDPRPKCDRCKRRYSTLDLVRMMAMQRAEAS